MVQLIFYCLTMPRKKKTNIGVAGKLVRKLYIIEVKKFRNEKQIQDSCIQLNAYLEQMDGEGLFVDLC